MLTILCRIFRLLVGHVSSSSVWLCFLTGKGIHGKPFIEWDDSGESKADDWEGYCPHNVCCFGTDLNFRADTSKEKLFLSWHRPFVMLYEVSLLVYCKWRH